MSSQKKVLKSRPAASQPGGSSSSKWVPKDTSRRSKAPKMDEPAEDRDPSLEDFCAEWEPLPDQTHASNNDYYFNSYAKFGIHEDMLKDQARTGSYMRAIIHNQRLFRGKTVLDVGSGTGILCLFAAKAGAKQVFGIECSDIADYATRIAAENGYAGVVTYIKGKVEEVDLPVSEVDIIISEWMGYFLIFESMLDSVFFARDKWLAKGGLLFPDRARLYMSAFEDYDSKVDKLGFWDRLGGFDFGPVKEFAIKEPISDIVSPSSLASTTCCFWELDLNSARKEDLDFVAGFNLQAERQDFLHALVVWFDVSFEACSPAIVLTTAPGKTPTHWKQTVLYFDEVVVAFPGDTLSGIIATRKSEKNPRELEVKVSYEFSGRHPQSKVQVFRVR